MATLRAGRNEARRRVQDENARGDVGSSGAVVRCGCSGERDADVERATTSTVSTPPWRAGSVFRDCTDCPEMVVLPNGVDAIGRYEVTLGEYRAFATATGEGAGGGCNRGGEVTRGGTRAFRKRIGIS